MPFNLDFPTQNPDTAGLRLDAGEMLFVLGANGTGKSSLMFRFSQRNARNSRKISAHRQTWMRTDALDMTAANKLQVEKSILAEDQQGESRWRDQYGAQRTSMTIYEIIDAQNVRARAIADAYDARDFPRADEAAGVEAPIATINDLLRQSNIPITITIRANEQIVASKDGGPEYSAAQLSDGERNALLIAGTVLTAPPGTLLIVDEPERHLHRSIIAPLLSQLFERRTDCGFVISTHDPDLPLEVPGARTLLIRSCTFNGQHVQSWEADELPAEAPIDDILKRDLLGARRKILFVEGTESSLDKPLYSLIFPMVSVIPKGNCREVEQAVVGVQAGAGFHWLRAFGIADGDGFGAEQVDAKRARGIYLLPYYSVEAIYFHPRVISAIAAKKAELMGGDAAELERAAISAGLAAIAPHTERLSRKVAMRAVRKAIIEQIPNDDEIMDGNEISVENDSAAIQTARKAELDAAVTDQNWETILTRCPVRESSALADISTALKFPKVHEYEQTVRHLLAADVALLGFVRSLFGNLHDQVTG